MRKNNDAVRTTTRLCEAITNLLPPMFIRNCRRKEKKMNDDEHKHPRAGVVGTSPSFNPSRVGKLTPGEIITEAAVWGRTGKLAQAMERQLNEWDAKKGVSDGER